jgi:hypothetical protein
MEIFGLFGLMLFAAMILVMKDWAFTKACSQCRKKVDARGCRVPLLPVGIGELEAWLINPSAIGGRDSNLLAGLE